MGYWHEADDCASPEIFLLAITCHAVICISRSKGHRGCDATPPPPPTTASPGSNFHAVVQKISANMLELLLFLRAALSENVGSVTDFR